MPKKAAISIEVSTDSKQGGRKYMEDEISVDFASTENGDFDFAFFAVFDGHGGPHASHFAKNHLMNEITKQKLFWSDDDENVKKSITEGFLSTHQLMWKSVGQWPRTLSGHPSTAGTTCSSVFITCDGKMYIGHAGDSGILLGVRDKLDGSLKAHCLTVDHKPESPEERKRIEECGGEVVAKAGVPRVVWFRPKELHKGPVRRSTELDRIPFLAVARSLGDLWSYNMDTDKFVVAPDPDVCSFELNLARHKCLILASDGLWNMVKPQEALDLIQHYIDSPLPNSGRNAAALLVQTAINRWAARGLRADNTSVIVVKLQEETSSSAPSTPLKGAPLNIEIGANVEIEDDEVMLPLTPSFSAMTPVPQKPIREHHSWKHKNKSALKKSPLHGVYHGKSPRSLSARHKAASREHKSLRALSREDIPSEFRPGHLDFVAVSKKGVKIYRTKDAQIHSAPDPPYGYKGAPIKRKSEEFVSVTKGGVTIVREVDAEPDSAGPVHVGEDISRDVDHSEEPGTSGNCRRVSVTKGGVTVFRDFDGGDDNDVEVYDQDIDLGASCEVEEAPGRVSPTIQLVMSDADLMQPPVCEPSPILRRKSPRNTPQKSACASATTPKSHTPKGSSSKSSTRKSSSGSSNIQGHSQTSASPVVSTLSQPSSVSKRRCSRSSTEKPCNSAAVAGPSTGTDTATPSPRPATSAQSPLKVDTNMQDSPVPALVSPIWPGSLEQSTTDSGVINTFEPPQLKEPQLPSMQQADILRENPSSVSRRARHASDSQSGSRPQTQGTQNISPITRLSRKRKNSLDSALSTLPISKRLRSRPQSEEKRLKPILAHKTRLHAATRGSLLARS